MFLPVVSFLQIQKVLIILFAKFIPSRSASDYCSSGFFGNYFREFTFHAVYLDVTREIKHDVTQNI